MKKQLIAKSAKIRKSKLESEYIEIGPRVNISGAYIKAKKIIIKSDAILTNCKIISDGPVIIGKNSTIKENAVINAFRGISIGDHTLIDRFVVIGGMQSEQSEFKIGDNCVILHQSYLNNTRKITIGNNVGIGGYCLIFTHSSWQNVLDGYPYKFADVLIHDNVWLPWNVTVFPGVSIGKNSIIGGGSTVTKTIPAGVFAAGIPAKIIRKKSNSELSYSKKNSITLEIIKSFGEYSRGFLKLSNSIRVDSKMCTLNFKKEKFVYTLDFKKIKHGDLVISFRIPDKIKKSHEWIELESLSSDISGNIGKQFLLFVKRYGIKIKNKTQNE